MLPLCMPVFTRANAAAMGAKGGRNRKGKGRKSPRQQIIELQASLHRDATQEGTRPDHRAACARAWDVLEDRLRVLDGKPLPGQLRPDIEQARKSRRGVGATLLSLPIEDDEKESLPPQGGGGGEGVEGALSPGNP